MIRMGSQRTIGHRSNGYGAYINCKGKLTQPEAIKANKVGAAESASA
jgi:hypothetical protein